MGAKTRIAHAEELLLALREVECNSLDVLCTVTSLQKRAELTVWVRKVFWLLITSYIDGQSFCSDKLYWYINLM